MNDEATFRGILAATFVLLAVIRMCYARRAGRAGEKGSAGRTSGGSTAWLWLPNGSVSELILPQSGRAL